MIPIAHVTVAHDDIYEIAGVDAITARHLVAEVLAGNAEPSPTWMIKRQPERILSARVLETPNEPEVAA
jgi:hypothetical protein